jgi:hypothetical protein
MPARQATAYLARFTNDLQGVQKTGLGKCEAQELQKMRAEIHTEREEIMEDWKLEEMLRHQDSSLTLRDIERIKDLRILLQTTGEKLSQLERDPLSNQETRLNYKTMVQTIHREIQKLERKNLYTEF